MEVIYIKKPISSSGIRVLQSPIHTVLLNKPCHLLENVISEVKRRQERLQYF